MQPDLALRHHPHRCSPVSHPEMWWLDVVATSELSRCQKPWKPTWCEHVHRSAIQTTSRTYVDERITWRYLRGRIHVLVGLFIVAGQSAQPPVLSSRDFLGASEVQIQWYPTRPGHREEMSRVSNLLRRPNPPAVYVTPKCHPLTVISSSATDSRNRDRINGCARLRRILCVIRICRNGK